MNENRDERQLPRQGSPGIITSGNPQSGTTRTERTGTGIERIKKAPRTLQSKTPRQPSPRTAKPLLDSRISVFFCKRHFGNRLQRAGNYCCLRQVWPASEVVQSSAVEVEIFPCCVSVNWMPMTSPVSTVAAVEGATRVQRLPPSEV